MKGSRGVPLIKDWAGALSEVGDHQSLVASLKTSPYYGMFKVSQQQGIWCGWQWWLCAKDRQDVGEKAPCAVLRHCTQWMPNHVGACCMCACNTQDEVGSWETRLSTLLEGLTLLQAIQRRWLYLEPIFGRGALPAVAGRFRHVDGEFRAIMSQLQVRVAAGRL